jgi:molybdopterin/thiamine biosynthesis adenylyltransferase
MEFLLDSHGAQNPSVCGVITGVTLESILRIVANRPDTLREKNIYNLKSRYLDGLVDDQDIELQDCSNSHVLLVGAGAMGNFVAINLALSGIKELTVLDYDYIAKKNLNRQVLYYGRELKQKVDVLEERLRKINPSLKVNAINFQVCIEKEKEFKNILKEKEIDVIVGCVDQIRPRLFLTYFINKNYEKLKVPYIDGACEVRMSKEMIPIGSASVFVHIPGKSSCMVCNNRDMPVMIQENVPEEREASCTAAQETQDERPNFSVISSNMTAASFITGELGRVINNSKDVHAHMSLTTQEPRGWINGFNTEPCNCKGIKPKYFKKLKLDPEHRSKYGR